MLCLTTVGIFHFPDFINHACKFRLAQSKAHSALNMLINKSAAVSCLPRELLSLLDACAFRPPLWYWDSIVLVQTLGLAAAQVGPAVVCMKQHALQQDLCTVPLTESAMLEMQQS